jgi:transposase
MSFLIVGAAQPNHSSRSHLGEKGGLMVSEYMFQKIRRHVRDGLSDSEISRKLDINRKTVAKYRKSNTPPSYQKRLVSTHPDKFAAFADRARQFLDATDNEITASEIYLLLKDEGYHGSERTLQRRLAELRPKETRERFFEQEYEPGEQSQFDFKEKIPLPFHDGPRVCHLHFSTLPYSDRFFIRAYPFRTFEAFMDGKHEFFDHIGGMTEKVRIDNLSPCVAKVLKGSQRKYTAAYQRAIDYYGFEVLPCRPATGSDKGDVERDIKTHIRRISHLLKLTGYIFRDWNDINHWLLNYCLKHQTSKSAECFPKEQRHLTPLPARDDSILCFTATLRATPHGVVRIDRCKASYSVPDEAIGRWCHVVVSAYDVKIYAKSAAMPLVAQHPRNPEGKPSILLEHVVPSIVRKPGAMLRWKHKDLLFPMPEFRRYYAYLRLIDSDSAEREFLRAVNLIQHATVSEIALAMQLVIDSQTDIPFEEMKKLLLTAGHVPKAEHLAQQPLQPRLSQYDSLIPNLKEDIAS